MIYFVRCAETNAVKIGFADNPAKRFGKIQSDSPGELELLAIEGGGKDREAELHVQFSAYRKRGEWFHGAPELMAYIAEQGAPVITPHRRSRPSNALAAWLYDNHLSMAEFGKSIGVCTAAICNFCNGIRIPRKDIMRSIYSATGGAVQPNDFYDLPQIAPTAQAPSRVRTL